MMAKEISFTLDGQEVSGLPGETIWQVAHRLGIEIPHLCYSPAPGYRADGNCRTCMVEIEGERVLAASCNRLPKGYGGLGGELSRAQRSLYSHGIVSH